MSTPSRADRSARPPALAPTGDRRPVRSRTEIRSLTGLRAVAATWVVLFHFKGQIEPLTASVPFVKPVLEAGWTGVELFFVLSGFVIARSYLEECGRRWHTMTALRFVFNRFARVWPAYAVVTVVALAWILGAGAVGMDTNTVAAHPEPSVLGFLRQLSMTQMWGREVFVGASYVPPAWSIGAEWAAYLAFPFLALLLLRLRRLPGIVHLALALACMAPLAYLAFEFGPLALHWGLRISCAFVAGVFAHLAVTHLQERRRAEREGRYMVAVALIGVLVVCLWNEWRRAGNPGVDFAGVMTIFYPLLIVGLTLTTTGPARLLASGPMVYGGRISYCLYLTHFVVQDVVYAFFWQTGPGELTPLLALAVPFTIGLAFLSAAALHSFVEEPGRRFLLGQWARWTGERRPAPAARHARPVLVPQQAEPPTERLAVPTRAVPETVAPAS